MLEYRVILVDDHAIVRRGLAALLHAVGRYAVVAEASNGEEALVQAEHHQPDLMIVDLSMPRLNGLETIRCLYRVSPHTRVLVLSMFDDSQFVAQALRHGARGYLLKHAMDDELFNALEAILRGETYVSSQINLDRIEEEGVPQLELTAREREVLQLIAEGKTTQQIAQSLCISPHTATRHRANLMQKLNAHNQAELIRVAIQHGLVIMPKA